MGLILLLTFCFSLFLHLHPSLFLIGLSLSSCYQRQFQLIFTLTILLLPPLYLIFPPSVPPHPPSPTPITTNVSLHHITYSHPNTIKLSSRHHHANNVSSLLHCRITIKRVVTYRKASTSYSSFILLLFLFLFFYSSFNPSFLNIQKNSSEFCDRKFVI